MTRNFPDSVTEQAQLAEVARRQALRTQVKASTNPELATRIGEEYSRAAWSQPGVVFATAQSNASPEVRGSINRMAGQQNSDLMDIHSPQKKNWFQRNLYDKLKTASRWTFAAMQTTPDLVQNAISDFGDSGIEEGDDSEISGWWKSTSLGSMMSDSKNSGEGFFMGKDIAKIQGERARRYRGEINGHAFTIGRGAASLVSPVDGKIYNLLSGTLDAAVNVAADPTNAVGKAFKAYNIGKTSILVTKSEASMAAHIAAGMATAEDVAKWDANATVKWFRTQKSAQRLFKFLGETKSISEVLEAYNWRIPLEVAEKIADESDPKKIEALVIGAASRLGVMDASDNVATAMFGNLEAGLVPQSLAEMPGARAFQKTHLLVEKSPLGKWANKWLAATPSSRVVIDGSAQQRLDAVKNYALSLKGLGGKVNDVKAKELVDRFAKSYAKTGTTRDLVESQSAYHDMIRETLKSLGIADEVIEATIKGEEEITTKLRSYMIDASGKHTDNEEFSRMYEAGLMDEETIIEVMGSMGVANIEDLRFAGPGAFHDLLNRVQVLPDFRKINRLATSPMYRRTLQRAVVNSKGDPRALVQGADFLQQELWKTSALATFGYVMRNLLDGQIKTTLKYGNNIGRKGGIATIFNDPVGYLMWASHRRGGADLAGELFKINPDATAANASYADAMGSAVGSAMDNQVNQLDNVVMSGNFAPVQFSPENRESYITGIIQRLARHRTDPIARMVVEGRSNEEILAYLYSEAGQETREALLGNLRRGRRLASSKGIGYVDSKTGKTGYIKVNLNSVEDENKALKIIVDANYRKPIEHISKANMEELQLAFLTNHVGTDVAETVSGSYFGSNGVQGIDGPGITVGSEYGIGSMFVRDVVDGPPARFAIENIRVDPSSGEKVYDIRYLFEEEAFVGATNVGSDSLRRIVGSKAEAQLLPQWTLHEIIEDADSANIPKTLEKTYEGWKRISSFFFDNISAKAMKRLEKDPLFRQYYYQVVDENIDLLSPTEAKKVLDNIYATAAAENVKPKSLATKNTLEKLQKQIDSGSSETGTIRELNMFAGRTALSRMGDVLFDAASKSNLEDAMRLAAPFGAAWREVMQKYMKIIAEDPGAVLRAGRTYNGLNEATALGGDNGLFYRDPVTGEMTFTFPLSGELTKLVTGVNAQITAPVKRLTMGFSVLPGLGPVGQIAASQLIPDKPMFDEISKFFMPYGEPEGVTNLVFPSWLTKMKDAFEANPEKMDGIYASTYVDVMRALSASGKYDLSTVDGKEQLLEDAKSKARRMTAIRAASQFFGPTAGTPVYKIETQQGDIFAGELVKEFQKLQSENYDTAVGKFIDTYGPEVEMYTASKTRSIYSGLEATKEFNDFDRDNPGLFDAYKNAAGYFAPAGSDFSFAAWERQLKTGKRERLSDREIIETAQRTIGSYKYRQLRLAFGSYPNDLQREWLKKQRTLLSKQYPGFPAKAVFEVGKLEEFVAELRNASQDGSVQGLPVTDAIKTYLDARDEALFAAEQRGMSLAQGKTAQPLRDWLLDRANQLISTTPEFARVFDRELAAEIED